MSEGVLLLALIYYRMVPEINPYATRNSKGEVSKDNILQENYELNWNFLSSDLGGGRSIKKYPP